MAKIPENRLKRRVTDLQIGEEGYVSTGALIVMPSRDVYLETNAQLLVEPSEFGCLLVRRVVGEQPWDVTLVHGRPYRALTTWEVCKGVVPDGIQPVASYREQEMAG